MKVPKMYKSSDLYDAGTDVIYDDDSKLQYAPFVYATSGSGDSDDDGGDDEEGEIEMFEINLTVDGPEETMSKTYNEILEAMNAGKLCVVKGTKDDNPVVAHVIGVSYHEGNYSVVISDVLGVNPDMLKMYATNRGGDSYPSYISD